MEIEHLNYSGSSGNTDKNGTKCTGSGSSISGGSGVVMSNFLFAFGSIVFALVALIISFVIPGSATEFYSNLAPPVIPKWAISEISGGTPSSGNIGADRSEALALPLNVTEER